MILPINAKIGDSEHDRLSSFRCIFCGESLLWIEYEGGYESVTYKDGHKTIVRRFHKECYLKNIKETKGALNGKIKSRDRSTR